MKKRNVLAISTILIVIPSLVFAEKIIPNPNDTSIQGFIIRIINYITSFAAALAVLFIIIGGLQYITSSGNEERIQVAKKTLLYAIIGLLLIVLSVVIINTIISTLKTDIIK